MMAVAKFKDTVQEEAAAGTLFPLSLIYVLTFCNKKFTYST
jgi:hypothetical protein